MKKLVALLSLAMFLIYSCNSQINEGDLVGNWKVIEFRADMPDLSPALIEGAKSEALSSSYSFLEGNTFNMKSDIIYNGEGGKYELISGKKVIKMTYNPGGDKDLEEYEIQSLDSKSMIWSQDMGDLGTLSMTLKKE